MKGRGRFTECVAVMMVAVLIAGAGSGAFEPGVSRAAAPELGSATSGRMMGWAQTEDQPPIEQVGEDVPGDPEGLDTGAPPAQTTGDTASQVEDVETLDQGSPPAAAPAPVTTTTTAPVVTPATATTVTAEPARASGPVLPPGFGSGRVHVAAGRSGVPVGLSSCHVGVITGRAYVGLDCEDVDAEDVVGFATSFGDFPFIPEVDFPFEGDEEFFLNPNFPFGDDDDDAIDNGFFASGRTSRDDTRLVVSAGQGARGATTRELAERGVAVTQGNGTIELAQRSRDRDPRVRVRDRGAKSTTSNAKKSRNKTGNSSKNTNRNANSSNSASAANSVEMAQSASRNGKKKRGKGKAKNKNRKKDKSQKANAKAERKQKAKAERKQKAKAERKQKARAERKQKAEATEEQQD